jgi:uncharacterized protein YndB with AHSA1/START domain
MPNLQKTSISVETTINAPVEKVWNLWTDPKHIIRWNNASEDWHTPRAENELRAGGKFLSRMESKDGKMGFDFTGEYNKVEFLKQINYTIADGRKVQVKFVSRGIETVLKETFEAEEVNPVEMQKAGWQSILDNFKKHVENYGRFEIMHFEIKINAPAEKVYKAMIDKDQYSEWTFDFNPTSHFKGSWDKGSKILFLGTDEKGNTGGMVSRIKENIPNKFLSIEHLGIIRNGEEIMRGEPVEKWAGCLENYTISSFNDKTILEVNIDSNDEFKSYFDETWPKALKKLKSICEEK